MRRRGRGTGHAPGKGDRKVAGRPAPRQDERPGLAARRGALRLLVNVLDKGMILDDGELGGRPEDRAQAHGLAALTLRRLGQIDDIIRRFADHPPKPPVNHALRLVTAELCFAGTPPHAAIDMAVRATKLSGAPRMAGLVNAVGRRISEQGAEIVARQDAAALNLPAKLGAALTADWGAEVATAIAAAHLVEAPYDLTPKDPSDGAAIAETLTGALLANGTVRVAPHGQISRFPGFAEGRWWVQDAAASLPATLLGDVSGKRVLDLCAAPGGKTMQLAAMGAEVTALDISKRRIGRIEENLRRTGLAADLVAADALGWSPAEPFDAILLDAPCSATGTIRRHPDLPHRGVEEGLADLVTLQQRLLDRAFEWLKPRGEMVFCTCSLFRAEGEEQVSAFLDRTPAATLRPVELPEMPWAVTDGCLRTRPDQWAEAGGLDGFFAAILRKEAT
ncbi:methyltransferase domain-containing protein [Rhodobacteraceae bacterium NNCM2]|nr:methyltransferase domain-containing protein [Coraliihabitans acroporae]